MICDLCSGRGWFSTKTNHWPRPCNFCNGAGRISWGRAARQLGEDPETLARIRQGKSRQKTCLRVLDKIAKILWPKGQQEMFG
jgi:hypothetical protein